MKDGFIDPKKLKEAIVRQTKVKLRKVLTKEELETVEFTFKKEKLGFHGPQDVLDKIAEWVKKE